MKKYQIFKITLVYLLGIVTPILHADEKYIVAIDNITKCAAILNTLARSTSTTDEEYKTHTLHEVANGSLIMSYHMADQDNFSREYVDSVYSGHESYYKTLKRLAIQANDYKIFENEINAEMPKCREINKIQAEYIKNLKKEMYKK